MQSAKMGFAAPEARPLDTPAQLLAWAASCPPEELDPLHGICRGSQALPPRRQGACPAPGPRLLACHDMAGGYGEDRLVQGGTDPDFYVLRRWACLDTFVYFSHRLVTIPPPGWINAAHVHGVRVLGTLITEWQAGAAACAQLFGGAEAAEAAAEALARIAACYGFEGWLVNIENEVAPGRIPNMLHFLRVLTERMREVAPGWSQVIWYDAVTTEGKLEWQNSLTPLNRPFFDACDALWVNYPWKDGTPAAVKQATGERAADVYMGVDCFGRGTYGGGGFSCGEALRASLEQGLSAALFAVGWPYEGDCGPDAPACWRRRDDLFWAGIEQAWRQGLCSSSSSTAGTGSSGRSRGAAAASVQPRPRLQLPLCSNSSPGSGRAFFQAGRMVSDRPWYNLSCQAAQPSLLVEALSEHSGSSSGIAGGGESSSGVDATAAQIDGPVQAGVSEERVFSGGSSLRLSGALRPGQRATLWLFEPWLELPAEGVWVRLTASLAGSAQLRLALHLAAADSTAAAGGMAAGSGSGTAQATDEALILLTPLFSAAAGGEAADAAGGAAARGSSGVRTTVSLSAGPSNCTAVHTAQTGCSSAASAPAAAAAAGMPDWQTFQFGLGPDVLAAAGSPGVLLAGVGLRLEGIAPAGGAQGSGGNCGPSAFEAYLGELCIEAGSPGSPPAAPGSVGGLRCEGLQLSGSGAGSDGGDPSSAMLAARLGWQAPAGGTRRCHVWCGFDGAAGQAAAEPRWLGVACANGFCASGMPVPAAATAVTFIVQAEGRNGLAQELAAAACVTVSLEG
ncbi:hypothetical protein ABPG75_004966 [Micractinium tetrahymenae]